MIYMKTAIDKTLYDISWHISEEEYREDKALSFSTLSRFRRTGFNGLKNLFDKIESPSLTFGSAVDSIITGGKEEFDKRFLVAEFLSVRESILPIVRDLFNSLHEKYTSLSAIPDKVIIEYAARYNYQNNWKPETRARVIKEEASEYYNLLHISGDRVILDTKTYQDVCNSVDALRNSPSTKWYFQPDNPWDNIQRFYQLKFKATLNGVTYRCMADELIVNHNDKTIIPVDLKTSSKPEWDFYKSFIEWDYQIQARLYWRIIRDVLDKDPVYKDYKLLDWRFIVVCKNTLKPLVWEFDKTTVPGNITYPNITLIDPEKIGRELNLYLSSDINVPVGIDRDNINNISYWLESYED